MSIIKGARNEDEAKKFYDWALTADVQSRAQDGELLPAAVEQGGDAVAARARPLDDQADRLRLQEVRLLRRAQAPAEALGRRGVVAAAVAEARAGRPAKRRPGRSIRSSPSGWRSGWIGFARPALVRRRRRLLRPSPGCFDGWPLDDGRRAGARSSSLQGEKLWLAPLGLLPGLRRSSPGAAKKSDPAFASAPARRRRRRPRVDGLPGLRHRPPRLALGLARRAVRRARRPPVRHGLRRACSPPPPSSS